MVERLGCADRYDVIIHWQGGGTEFLRPTGISDVSWSRQLDDYSEASITITKSHAGPGCCRSLGQVRTWSHELSIYRDLELVWQGPIVQKSEKGATVELTARDMIAWWDRRMVRPREFFPPDYPNDLKPYGYPPIGTVTSPTAPKTSYHYWKAYDCGLLVSGMVRDAFWPLSDWDPNMWRHTHWWDNPGLTIDEWIATGTAATTDLLWTGTVTVGEVARDVLKSGADLYTVGRKIYFVSEASQRRLAPYRLSADDFLDDLEVRENGLEAATRGFCVGQQPVHAAGGGEGGPPSDPGPGVADDEAPPVRGVVPGRWVDRPDANKPDPKPLVPDVADPPEGIEPGFGLLDRLAESDNTVDPAAARAQALGMRTHGFPPPLSLIVPDNARLSPHAPISMGQLVPGRPVMVALGDYCTPVHATFRISEVEVSWGESETEEISVSFAAMNPPPKGADA